MGTDFPTGMFFWRVRTLDPVHDLSPGSAVRPFTVGTPVIPSAPTLLSPAYDARLNQPISFDLSDVNGAASYTIQIDNSNSFTTPLAVNQSVVASEFTSNSLLVATL
jgi:hypothetical protein